MSHKIFTVDFVGQDSSLTLALSSKKISDSETSFNQCYLRLEDEFSIPSLRSRYSAEAENPLHQLEHHLMRLSQNGELGTSEIIFGCYSDPFFPFQGKFDVSIKALELFARYVPGHLTIQTRSPLLVIALPVLKRLGNRVTVSVAVETNDENSVYRYTPGLPRIEERLKMVTALRRFGIETAIQVAPVLPYGDWKNDAQKFAQTLIEHADFITVLAFNTLIEKEGLSARAVKNQTGAARLAEDRKFHWLRADSANPLLNAIEAIDGTKLKVPTRTFQTNRQLTFFAA
jgi:DNA repair photolyase